MVLEQKQIYRSIESPEINSEASDQLIYDKQGRLYNGEKTVFFNKWCWENWAATCKRIKIKHSVTPQIKMNWKLVKDLNVKPEGIKFLEKSIGTHYLT